MEIHPARWHPDIIGPGVTIATRASPWYTVISEYANRSVRAVPYGQTPNGVNEIILPRTADLWVLVPDQAEAVQTIKDQFGHVRVDGERPDPDVPWTCPPVSSLERFTDLSDHMSQWHGMVTAPSSKHKLHELHGQAHMFGKFAPDREHHHGEG